MTQTIPAARATPCGHLAGLAGAPDCRKGHDPAAGDCPDCSDYLAGINQMERTRCEVWTRVMGYHRPISAFNAGKRSEHRERKHFAVPDDDGQAVGAP